MLGLAALGAVMSFILLLAGAGLHSWSSGAQALCVITEHNCGKAEALRLLSGTAQIAGWVGLILAAGVLVVGLVGPSPGNRS
jgi:hypothetical protein